MARWENDPRRLGDGQSRCPECGLWQDLGRTLEQDWVLLEPEMRPLAHTVPAEHRWIELSDGRVTVYEVCPPDQFQCCRVPHRLACPAQPLLDLWPSLTDRRRRNAERRNDPGQPPTPGVLPDTG
jgi:hypothetical protein